MHPFLRGTAVSLKDALKKETAAQLAQRFVIHHHKIYWLEKRGKCYIISNQGIQQLVEIKKIGSIASQPLDIFK